MDIHFKHFKDYVYWHEEKGHVSTLKFLGRRSHIVRREIGGDRRYPKGTKSRHFSVLLVNHVSLVCHILIKSFCHYYIGGLASQRTLFANTRKFRGIHHVP